MPLYENTRRNFPVDGSLNSQCYSALFTPQSAMFAWKEFLPDVAGWGDIILLFTGNKLGGKLSAAPRRKQVGISHVQVQKQVPGLNPEFWNRLL